VAVITGGNTGIGKETALELAKQGCQIVIGARDVKKSIATIEEIIQLTNNKEVFQISLDLGSKESINQFSD
jgi:NAD(P)-dependent dehydrogenase (short-subunit alcohol dehydrogenase family)